MNEEQKQMIEILSDKMDTLRCLSCSKYFPDPCEDCSFVEVFNDVVDYFASLLQKEREAGKREGIEEAIKELGFDDYDKHVHTYANEGSGKCGICGLSWRTTTIYGCYNTAIVQVKKLLRKKLKSQSVEKSNSLQE